MKITKRQLRRIIREEKARLLKEASEVGPELRQEESQLISAIEQFFDKYAMVTGLDPMAMSPNDRENVVFAMQRVFDKTVNVL